MINKLIEQKIKELNLEENKDSYTARHITRKSMFDLKYKNIFNQFLGGKKNSNIFINITKGDVSPSSSQASITNNNKNEQTI